MFTIKYIYPTGQQSITGPYELVSAEWVDPSGNHVDPRDPPGTSMYQVVYGYKAAEDRYAGPSGMGASMTFGPNLPPESSAPVPKIPGYVYVMNEHGATVAKYEL